MQSASNVSDIVSHQRNNYRQVVTQQLQKNVFKTIVTFPRAKNKQTSFSK